MELPFWLVKTKVEKAQFYRLYIFLSLELYQQRMIFVLVQVLLS